jgi:integrase
MPRKPGIPSLRRHRPSHQGVVTLNGRDHYLGHWPADQDDPPPEVRAAYDRKISEWLAGNRCLPDRVESGTPSNGITVAELVLAFYRHCQDPYRREDGSPTTEVSEYRRTLALLRRLYGETDVKEFGPLKLKALREHMIGKGWCRRVINQRMGRVVRCFKWGVGEELVPPTVHQALDVVPGLQKGRTKARESEPVEPVAWDVVEPTLAHMPALVAAAVRVMWLTGARPGEALAVRLAALDRSGQVWNYRPGQHKTSHRGKRRVLAIGPKAQQVLLACIKIRCPICGNEGRPPRMGCRDNAICGPCADEMDDRGICGPWPRFEAQPADAYLFSPAVATQERYADMRARRKTKVQPSQISRAAKKPKKKPGQRYSVESFNRAVARACEAAGVESWHPHQLRHAHATEVRRRYGLEAAQVALGHSQADVTQIYAERDLSLAERVAREIG